MHQSLFPDRMRGKDSRREREIPVGLEIYIKKSYFTFIIIMIDKK